ncbi:MAG: DEAD/DEAH box helicase, partial [Atopostipes sp.]|nr:DEAD/DEAH box helicase [Atopostipes sp.]
QSGALLSLEDEGFDAIQQMFTDLNIGKDDLQDGSVKMPIYRSAQVDELVGLKKQYDPSFQKLLHQLKSPEEQHFELPENLQATLREYQETGFQWFKSLSHYYLGGILADDMGLGKTLQTIAYVLSEPSEYPHLIVVPSSVVYNWKNEFQKFAPDLSVEIVTGAPPERRSRMEHSEDKDVWITSYSTLRQDIDIYRELTFQTMILDEAQFIKNYATKTSQAIRQVTASRRFALSGTPIENSIEELWAIFQVVLPGLMPSQKKFKQLSHEKIASMTKPFILRRLKQDVLKELPDKIESVYISELTKDQKDLYVGYLRQLQQEANQSIKDSGFNHNRMKILAGLTRLRQLCCHPSLFIENYQGKSGKLEQLMETVQQTLESGGRMLVFSQFTSMHEIIKAKLEEAGIDSFYLHGGTPSQERVDMSERFNNGEKDVFLISLKAGGTGLNLTGADTVILYDLWWNPAVEDQATGRAHRFGQKKVVQVIRLITEGTIEEKIYALQQKKRELID